MLIGRIVAGFIGCLLMIVATTGSATADTVVVIPDAALRQCLATHFARSADQPVTKAELNNIRSLDCSASPGAAQIIDLTGLQQLTGAEELKLNGQKVTSVAPLAELHGLAMLTLEGNPLSDVSVVAGLKSLRVLRAQGVPANLAPLAAAKTLVWLTIGNNRASDYGFLSALPALVELTIEHGPATTIERLGSPPNLVSAHINGNALTTIAPGGLTTVQDLSISQTKLTDLDAFKGLTRVQTLRVSNGSLNDASGIAGLTTLQSVDLSSNKLATIPDLSALDSMTLLNVSGNALKHVDVRGLRSLSTLHAWSNEAATVNLDELPALIDAVLSNNALTDISALANLPALRRLNVLGNRLADVSAFAPDIEVIATHQYIQPGPATVGEPAPVSLKGFGGMLPTLSPDPGATVADGMVTYRTSGTHSMTFTQTLGASTFAGQWRQKAGPDVPFEKTERPGLGNTVAAVGSDLVVGMSSWTPHEDYRTYAWYRDGVRIADADQSTYRMTPADFGHRLKASITVVLDGYISQTVWSKESAKVGAGHFTRVAISVSGTAKTGQVLKASVKAWNPAPARCTYFWDRNYKKISGATKSTYTLTASDLGKRIRVGATCWARGLHADTAYAKRTVTVTQGPVRASTPTVAGTPKAGQKLTIAKGSWGPGTITFSYQWLRDGKSISKATKSSYTLTASDIGHQLSVKLKGDRTSYTAVTRTSAAITVT